MQTSRELVRRAVKFETPARIPRTMWTLPWVELHYPEEMKRLRERFPDDFGGPAHPYRPSPRVKGDPYVLGEYIDDWGCVFENLQAGVHGEVRQPILTDLDDWKTIVRPPYETLPEDYAAARDAVNRSCAASDKFLTGGCCPRPWERYQFLRKTEDAMCDMMDPDVRVRGILKTIHEYHLKEYEFWAKTDVDALTFMDDWGSQRQLLLPPSVWRELYKPMYRDYIQIAHAHGKLAFMHSDGHLLEVLPDLVELGLDALNSQLFCMDMEAYARIAKGKLTLWGEIDRQHIMPSKDPEDGRRGVRRVAELFYDPRGGIIAQCEVGSGGNPAVAWAIYDEWEKIGGRDA